MYARSSTINGNPRAVDDGLAFIRDTAMPSVQRMDGYVGMSMLVDREWGGCIVTTAWADAEAMRASAEEARTMRDRIAEMFGGLPDVQEWEVAVLHRVRHTGDGARTRVTWVRGEPDRIERMVDAFKLAFVPQLEELPGFCSVNLMVDRENGQAASTVTLESREAMDRTRQSAAAMRERFIKEMGVEVTDIHEYDLVLAHLHVPETV